MPKFISSSCSPPPPSLHLVENPWSHNALRFDLRWRRTSCPPLDLPSPSWFTHRFALESPEAVAIEATELVCNRRHRHRRLSSSSLLVRPRLLRRLMSPEKGGDENLLASRPPPPALVYRFFVLFSSKREPGDGLAEPGARCGAEHCGCGSKQQHLLQLCCWLAYLRKEYPRALLQSLDWAFKPLLSIEISGKSFGFRGFYRFWIEIWFEILLTNHCLAPSNWVWIGFINNYETDWLLLLEYADVLVVESVVVVLLPPNVGC